MTCVPNELAKSTVLSLPASNEKPWVIPSIVIQACDLPVHSLMPKGAVNETHGEVDCAEIAPRPQKAVRHPGRVVVIADDFSLVVDAAGERLHGVWKVDRDESCPRSARSRATSLRSRYIPQRPGPRRSGRRLNLPQNKPLSRALNVWDGTVGQH